MNKSIRIKCVLLAEAQRQRLHSTFVKPFYLLLLGKSVVNAKRPFQNVYRQEEEPEEAAGEDGLLHANTIEDCELRSLLNTSIIQISLKRQIMHCAPLQKNTTNKGTLR